jgi:tripartite-type tricarboxylate transporter receptor subunit TctC
MLRYLALIAAALMATSPALAQQDPAADYPNRPVKIIVSVPAGGGVDTVTRIFAARLQQRLGQPFVIENRGGGGGNIGAEAVYTAEPDGYTLLATQPAPITSNIALYKKLNFDPVALEPVAVMSKFPNVLLVRQDFPAKTVQEFIAYAKANPGKVTYASQGPGTTSHLTAELFAKATEPRCCMSPIAGPGPRSTISSRDMSTSFSWSLPRATSCTMRAKPGSLRWPRRSGSICCRTFRP